MQFSESDDKTVLDCLKNPVKLNSGPKTRSRSQNKNVVNSMKNIQLYTCNICSAQLPTKSRIAKHIASFHFKDGVNEYNELRCNRKEQSNETISPNMV